MAVLTTERGAPYPDLAEDPNPPQDIQALAEWCNDQFIAVAALGDLPAAGELGREAYVTATGRTYVDTGAAWALKGSINLVEHADPSFTGVMTIDTDVNLYRLSAGIIKTDATFAAAGSIFSNQGTAWQIRLSLDGSARPVVLFGTALDTNLYRAAAGVLQTDTVLRSGQELYARVGAAGQVKAGLVGANAGLEFGAAADTNLYRAGANQLKTDDDFIAGANLYIGTAGTTYMTGANGDYAVSASGDLGFYLRSRATNNPSFSIGLQGTAGTPSGYLQIADSAAYRTLAINPSGGPVSIASASYPTTILGSLYFGSAQDTNLYRSAADTLKTDDAFLSASFILANHGTNAKLTALGWNGTATAAALAFGDGAGGYDTNLYRSAANVLSTDDAFRAAGIIYGSLGTNAVGLGAIGPAGKAGLVWGGAEDVNLYRDAADILRTDDAFKSAGHFRTLSSTKTANYNVTTADDVIIGDSTASIFTVTLPTAATAGAGRIFTVKNIGTADSIMVAPQLGEKMNGVTNGTISANSAVSPQSVRVYSDGVNGYRILA